MTAPAEITVRIMVSVYRAVMMGAIVLQRLHIVLRGSALLYCSMAVLRTPSVSAEKSARAVNALARNLAILVL